MILSFILLILNAITIAPLELTKQSSNEIIIFIEDCVYDNDSFYGFEMTGNIDLLIEKSTYKGVINTEMSRLFQEVYPNFESYGFLDDGEFISYYAYAKHASVETKHTSSRYMGKCSYMFGRFSLRDLGNFKLVYFLDDGTIVHQTELIEMPVLTRYDLLEGHLVFNTTTLTLTSTLDTYTNQQVSNLLFIVFILAFFYITVTISLRLLLSYFGKCRLKFTKNSIIGLIIMQFGYIPLIMYSYHNMVLRDTPLELNAYYIALLTYFTVDLMLSSLILKPKRIFLYIFVSIIASLPFVYYLATVISKLVSDIVVR